MKEDIQQAIEFLTPIVGNILKVDIQRHINFVHCEQKLKRGQGKRIKGMVVGAGTTCYGSKVFTAFNLLEYKNDLSDEKLISLKQDNLLHLYLCARNYGLDSELSFKFAKLWYFGKIKIS